MSKKNYRHCFLLPITCLIGLQTLAVPADTHPPAVAGYENFPKAEIRRLNGVGTLFVNDRPSVRIGSASTSDHGGSIAEKLDCGMEIVKTQAIQIGGPALREQSHGEIDWSMTKILDAIPDAHVIVRVTVLPSVEFLEAYPESWVTGANGEQVFEERFNQRFEGVPQHRPSWASIPWREYVDRELRDFIAHMAAQPYAGHIVGINLSAGHTGEFDQWFGGEGWPGGNGGDWSGHSLAHFREWLRAHYDHDVDALRKAWDDPDVTFETADISRDPIAWSDVAGCQDPTSNRARVDYNIFHGLQIHEVIEAWCRSVKQASGGRLVAGAMWAVSDGGTHLMNTSPWVDFGSGPGTYFYREPGNHRRIDFIGEDLRLHGKWFFEEMDLRTLFYGGKQFAVETMEKTLSVLARTHAQITTEGVGGYWYEFRSSTYRHPAIWRLFRRQAAISELAASEPRTMPAEILVVVSSCGLGGWRGDLRTNVLPRLGAPYHSVFLETLMMKDVDLTPYKLVVINSVHTLKDDERAWLRERMFRDGRWVVFLRPAGTFAPDAEPVFSIDNAVGLMGITLAPNPGDMRQATQTFTAQSLLAGLPEGTLLETDESEVLPSAMRSVRNRTAWTVVDDPDAIALTRWPDGSVAAAIKPQNDWTSVYLPALNVSSAVLRSIGDEAGVHRYVPGDEEVVYAAGNLLNIHARAAGARRVRLRQASDLFDLYTGCFVGRGQSEYEVQMDALSNHLFYLGDPRGKLAEIDAAIDDEVLERLYLQEERRVRRLEEQTASFDPGPHDLLPNGKIRNWLFAGPLESGLPTHAPGALEYEVEQLRIEQLATPLAEIVPVPFERLHSREGDQSFAWRPVGDGNARFFAADYYSRPERNLFMYVACYLESPTGGDYNLHLRTERGHQLYLDAEKIGESFYQGRVGPMQLDFPVRLEPGRRHRLLFEMFSGGGGNSGWNASLTTANGEPTCDVQVYLEPAQ